MPEYGRLPGAVRADDAEPRPGVDLKRDSIEYDMGAVLTDDIDELKTHENLRTRRPRTRRVHATRGGERT